MINVDDPKKDDVTSLIKQLDEYQASLYPAASNHFVPIKDLTAENVVFVSARIDDKAVGCGALVFHDGWAEVKRMYVSPEARGQGIAKDILSFLQKEALTKNIKVLKLETGIHQAEAIKFYLKEGFKQIGPFGEYKEDPLSRFYEKKL